MVVEETFGTIVQREYTFGGSKRSSDWKKSKIAEDASAGQSSGGHSTPCRVTVAYVTDRSRYDNDIPVANAKQETVLPGYSRRCARIR